LQIPVFAHEVCDVSEETKIKGRYFYLGTRTQGKISAFQLVKTASPTHTDVSVIWVFVKIKTRGVATEQKSF